jgi:hypothetical protein
MTSQSRWIWIGSVLALACGAASIGRGASRRAIPDLAPVEMRSCKPEAPIELRLGAARPIGADAVEVEYRVVAGVDCELLEPLVELGAGWQLAAHTPALVGPAERGTERVGRLVLQRTAQQDAPAALRIVARFNLYAAEGPGGRVEQQRPFTFGASLPKPVVGIVRVRAGGTFSNDVPALAR